MGMYIGLRFIGIVKEIYREEFESIILNEDIEENSMKIFTEIRKNSLTNTTLDSMPSEWETNHSKNKFDNTYNKESGKWAFQDSIKNGKDTISCFLSILPYFIESADHIEVYYEEWDWSKKYELIDRKIKMTKPKFMFYGIENRFI